MDKTQIDAAVAEIKSSVADLKDARGIVAIIKAIPHVIEHVEAASQKLGIGGADKRTLALDIIFALAPIPFYLKPFAPLLRMAVGQMIDMAVAAVNKKLGK